MSPISMISPKAEEKIRPFLMLTSPPSATSVRALPSLQSRGADGATPSPPTPALKAPFPVIAGDRKPSRAARGVRVGVELSQVSPLDATAGFPRFPPFSNPIHYSCETAQPRNGSLKVCSCGFIVVWCGFVNRSDPSSIFMHGHAPANICKKSFRFYFPVFNFVKP